MRVCTVEDFTKRNFIVNENFAYSINKRLCPDIPKEVDHYHIKNLYQDKNERTSFSIQILKCKNSKTLLCKDDSLIERLFHTFLFNQQVLVGQIYFHSFTDKNDKRDLSSPPVKMEDI